MSSGYSSQRLIDFTPATRFYPPNPGDIPQTLFTVGNPSLGVNVAGRFLRNSNPGQMLIYTDGSCLRNGKPFPVGGCAFVFEEPKAVNAGIVSFPLEDHGPSGAFYKHTNNRAELRAVIAGLQFCLWNGDGYDELVIATDSKYVVEGATEHVADWVKRGWRTSKGKNIENKDLWEMLFEEIQHFKENQQSSLCVLFWRIPREWNTVADWGAKEAAMAGERRHSFSRIVREGPICQVKTVADWGAKEATMAGERPDSFSRIVRGGPICQARTSVAMAHGARAGGLHGAQRQEVFWSCNCCGVPNSHFVP